MTCSTSFSRVERFEPSKSAFLHSLPLQPGPPRPVRAGIRSRQLPPLRPSKRCFLLVAPKRPAEAHKDRGKGGEPIQEHHFPVRRGGDLSSRVRRHAGAYPFPCHRSDMTCSRLLLEEEEDPFDRLTETGGKLIILPTQVTDLYCLLDW